MLSLTEIGSASPCRKAVQLVPLPTRKTLEVRGFVGYSVDHSTSNHLISAVPFPLFSFPVIWSKLQCISLRPEYFRRQRSDNVAANQTGAALCATVSHKTF
jgi:hypothetical protein